MIALSSPWRYFWRNCESADPGPDRPDSVAWIWPEIVRLTGLAGNRCTGDVMTSAIRLPSDSAIENGMLNGITAVVWIGFGSEALAVMLRACPAVVENE